MSELLPDERHERGCIVRYGDKTQTDAEAAACRCHGRRVGAGEQVSLVSISPEVAESCERGLLYLIHNNTKLTWWEQDKLREDYHALRQALAGGG